MGGIDKVFMPTGGKKKKQNLLTTIIMLGIIALGVGILYNAGNWAIKTYLPSAVGNVVLAETPEQQIAEAKLAGITEADVLSCNGVSSINALYDDKNIYKVGTDPGTNLSIIDPISKQVLDDATSTTVPIKSTIKALAGNSLGVHSESYFAEEIEFTTTCSDLDIQTELAQMGAPTLTFVNDDGKTVNSDANGEAMDASTSYSACLTIKAPSDKCSSKHGAVITFDYDATFINNIESTDLDSYNGKFLEARLSAEAQSTPDQTIGFFYPESLCDGARDEVCFDITTTSSAPDEGNSSMAVRWWGMQKDLNADDLKTVITGIYDEDNNLISIGNKTGYYYGQ